MTYNVFSGTLNPTHFTCRLYIGISSPQPGGTRAPTEPMPSCGRGSVWSAGDDSAQPSQPSQSSADSTVDEQPRLRTQHRRLLHVDGRSSSETSGGSSDKVITGRSLAVQHATSVDEGTPRYDTLLTCAQQLTNSQLHPPHGTKQKE